MANLQTISTSRAAELIRTGAVLVDIRESDEYAREHRRTQWCIEPHRSREPGARSLAAVAQNCQAYILEGGLEAWKKAGHPVTLDRSQPIDIMRQVQIGAGSLVLLGVVLGASVAPAFYALSGFVGAGLLFAGVSGFCGMARLLSVMPLNRCKPAG
jgi:rhodanese-related sulfurtransferase